MATQRVSRRTFLNGGVAGFAAFAVAALSPSKTSLAEHISAPQSVLNTLGALLPADNNGVMLPAGFQSKIVARSGQSPTANGSYAWHGAPDGGACFPTEEGGWVYVSNSELSNRAGGAGALRFSPTGEVVDAYPILQNSSNNCAGGATPWQTWLSCEESERGMVYECDPLGIKPPQLRAALGAFWHEAVAVHLASGYLYLTEDARDGGFYRFRPQNEASDLSAGILEIAAVKSKGGRNFIDWLTVPDPSAVVIPTRHQLDASSVFAGGEGISIFSDKAYFTTKRDNRVWCFDLISQELTVLYDIQTSANPLLSGVDNIVISPAGDVIVAEDRGNMQLVALTADHLVVPLIKVIGQDRSEITGPAFSPDFQRLYFSSQRGRGGSSSDGLTYEISAIGS
ncbi:MAG: translocation protein TolB [SAR86 cluster bacterium]|uniref:Translocation protein TolB n=1 Tax=SAR86 cluster bacterium TaxID=2030880 RepID=A0A2A4MJW2_9GAMM|nr:MAG: translocation protein TolB [SAR86 cluster bacterium]